MPNEGMSDLRCLCFDHHPKGNFSLHDIQLWRSSYLWRKRSVLLLKCVVAATAWTLRMLARTSLKMALALLRSVKTIRSS